MFVHAQHRERVARHAQRDVPFRAHFGVIAHTPQQAVGHARSAAAAPRDFGAPSRSMAMLKNFRRPLDDAQQILRRVELQPVHDAESRAQRRHDQPGARGGADQGEAFNLIGMHARTRAPAR